MKKILMPSIYAITTVGLLFGFLNCGVNEMKSLDQNSKNSEMNEYTLASSADENEKDSAFESKFPSDIDLGQLEKVQSRDWANAEDSQPEEDASDICKEKVSIPLSLNNGSQNTVSFKNKITNEVDTINIRICKKPAIDQADYKIGSTGFYKRENIIKACPAGYHPLERMELQHINAAHIENVILNKGNKIFRNGLEYRGLGSSQLWTFDNLKSNVTQFSAIYVSTTNSKKTVTVQNSIELGDSAELALPVVCVDNHYYSRNAKSDIQIAGCEYLFNFEGLKVCHQPSELFKDYSRIFNTSEIAKSRESNNELFANYIGIKFKDSSLSIMHSLETMQLPKDLNKTICPVGFIKSSFAAVDSIIESGLRMNGISVENGDVYCVKNDENYDQKLLELSGCHEIKDVDGLRLCRQASQLKVCLKGYHFFNALEFEAKKHLLFDLNESTNRSMQFPLTPNYFVKGNNAQVYVEGLQADQEITYCWYHNGSRTCRLQDGAKRGWRLTSVTSNKDISSRETVEKESLQRICVQD